MSHGDTFDLSVWLPDPDEGAKLVTAYGPTGTDPSTFLVTAIMLFAMEEMGQVDPNRYGYRVMDDTSSVVSIRNANHGQLIGAVLFVGKGAGRLFEGDVIGLSKFATGLVVKGEVAA